MVGAVGLHNVKVSQEIYVCLQDKMSTVDSGKSDVLIKRNSLQGNQ